jgi:hypothetical protein
VKLSDARQASEDFSGKASEIVRQLGLAGLAVVWIFKEGTSTNPVLDPKLIHAAILIVISLILDFSQYLVSHAIWSAYFRRQENKGKDLDDNVYPSSFINWPNLILFYAKSVVLLIAYAFYILPYLSWKLVK